MERPVVVGGLPDDVDRVRLRNVGDAARQKWQV